MDASKIPQPAWAFEFGVAKNQIAKPPVQKAFPTFFRPKPCKQKLCVWVEIIALKLCV